MEVVWSDRKMKRERFRSMQVVWSDRSMERERVSVNASGLE
ncbi:hypothetical protein [Neobacillus niacini]|nr:hypothetical protein [Neobacillus niacini]